MVRYRRTLVNFANKPCDFLTSFMQSQTKIQTYWFLSYSNKYFPKQIFMPKSYVFSSILSLCLIYLTCSMTYFKYLCAHLTFRMKMDHTITVHSLLHMNNVQLVSHAFPKTRLTLNTLL